MQKNAGGIMNYSESLQEIRKNLIHEAKKMLPLNYCKNEADGFWSVDVNENGIVDSDGYAKDSGVYIGKSIDELSLSDIALLIDNKLGNEYA
jgi:hypothetical protein